MADDADDGDASVTGGTGASPPGDAGDDVDDVDDGAAADVVVSLGWLADRLGIASGDGDGDGDGPGAADEPDGADGPDGSDASDPASAAGDRGTGGLVVVDVRDEWEYEGIGHVPGAVNVPFDAFRSEAGDEGMLPGADVWRDLLGSAGATADDTLVAYDDQNGVFAARFLVTALAYGHPPERLRLLDGDYSAWTRSYPVTTDVPDRPAADYEVREPTDDPFVDYETVRALVDAGAVERGEAVLLDTREPDEWAAGHVPGAVQVDWREFVDEETRGLDDDAALAATLADHGVTPGTRVVLYCNTARRISHTYLVLRHLGYDDVGFYEGSLTEWTERGGPLERGEDGEGGAGEAAGGEAGDAEGGEAGVGAGGDEGEPHE